MVVKELFIKLGLDTNAASFASAQVTVDALEGGLQKLYHWGMKAAVAIKDWRQETIDAGTEAFRGAQRVGLTTDAFQELGFAANASGVEAGTLNRALIAMARTAYGAAEGGEEMAKSFATLGVSVRGADGKIKPVDVLLEQLADKFSKMPDGIEKTALAAKTLGRIGGAGLLPFLNKGKKGIDELRVASHEYGVVMNAETIKATVDADISTRKLGASFAGLRNAIFGPLLPGMTKLNDKIALWIRMNRELIATKVAYWIRELKTDIHDLIQILSFLASHWMIVIAAIVAFKAEAIASGIVAAASWLLAAAPLILLGLLITAIVLAWEDVVVALRGGDSLIGDLGVKWTKFLDDWTKPVSGDWWVITQVKEAVRWLTSLGDKLYDFKEWASGDTLYKKNMITTATSADQTPSQQFGALLQPQRNFAASTTNMGAKQFSANITIQQQPGQDSTDLASALSGHLDNWWETKMSDAHGAVQ